MSPADPRPTTPPPADRDASTRALTERQMAKLERLAEIGMEIAEAAGRAARAVAEGAGADGADPGLTYSRAARAVRLTIALQCRLTEGLAALDQAARIARVGEASRCRHRVHRLIETCAEAEGCEADAVEALSSEAWERLTETEDDDILDLPFDEVVARICRDLGLSPAQADAFAAPGLSQMADSPPPAAPSAARMVSPAIAGEEERPCTLLPCEAGELTEAASPPYAIRPRPGGGPPLAS
jgi:hypothetical protein